MADEFVQGNTGPAFRVQLLDKDGAPVDLSGCSVTFYFQEQLADVAKVAAGVCTITDIANGEVEYAWGATDLDVPGIYDADFRVTLSDATVQSVLMRDVQVLPKLT